MLLFLFLSLFADSSMVRIQTMPNEVILVLNEDFSSPIAITSGDSLMLPEGYHTVRFTHPSYGDRVATLEVLSGEERNLRVDLRINEIRFPNTSSTWFVLRNQANLVVETDADTRIFYNGNDIGLGLAMWMVKEDEPISVIELQQGSIRKTIPIDFDSKPSVFVSHYLKPHLGVYLLASPVPGLSQAYEGSYVNALLMATATIGGIRYLQNRNKGYHDRKSDYRSLRRAYEQATDFDEVERRGNAMRAYYPHVERAAQLRDISAVVLGSIYAIHLIDVAIPPKYGFRKVSVGAHPYKFVGAEIRLGL